MLIYQPGACRFRLKNGRRVGTVPVGSIVYLQDGLRPLSGFRREPFVLVNPWQVVAFRPQASSFDGQVRRTYGCAYVVKSLRDGRTAEVQEWFMLAHDDAFLVFDKGRGIPPKERPCAQTKGTAPRPRRRRPRSQAATS